MEVSINSQEIASDYKNVFENVIEIVILNYSEGAIKLIQKGVTVEIPGATSINGTVVPSLPFAISCFGLPIKSIPIEIKFPTKRGRVVINSSIIEKC
jgi:hypothetical protein